MTVGEDYKLHIVVHEPCFNVISVLLPARVNKHIAIFALYYVAADTAAFYHIEVFIHYHSESTSVFSQIYSNSSLIRLSSPIRLRYPNSVSSEVAL